MRACIRSTRRCHQRKWIPRLPDWSVLQPLQANLISRYGDDATIEDTYRELAKGPNATSCAPPAGHAGSVTSMRWEVNDGVGQARGVSHMC